MKQEHKVINEYQEIITIDDDFQITCNKPVDIFRDEQERLHNENGPAVTYIDGFGIYSIHGITVDEKIVMRPQEITKEEIQKENNQEKRRIMIERRGVDKYLEEIDAKVIDVDFAGAVGGGARVLMREPETGNQWLVATDGSTNRIYHLFVPKEVKTCKEAHEALCGFDESRVKMEGLIK